MRNVSGTARPAVVALACGLMFAAMLGAISATDRPTAAQMDSPRFSPNTGYPSAAWPGSADPAVGDGVAAIVLLLVLSSVPIVSLRTWAVRKGQNMRKRRFNQVFLPNVRWCEDAGHGRGNFRFEPF